MANATLSTSRCHGYVGPVYIQLLASCALIIFLSRLRQLQPLFEYYQTRLELNFIYVMAAPPGTPLLSKGARKFYQDLGPPFNEDSCTDMDMLPPPVDPRGQVPVSWSLTPCTSGLRATFVRVPHTSRSMVRSTTSNVRWQAPDMVRAPLRSTTRTIPLGRDMMSNSAPLLHASAQRHAPYGSSPQVYGSAQQHAQRSLQHAPMTHRSLLQPVQQYGRSIPPLTMAAPQQPSMTYLQPQQQLPMYQPQPRYQPQPVQQQTVQHVPTLQLSNDESIRQLSQLLLQSLSTPQNLPAPASQATILDLSTLAQPPGLFSRPDPLRSL
jgi:hypothetical protein